MMSLADVRTIADVYRRILKHDLPAAALLRDASGQYIKLSSRDMQQRVNNVARALIRWGIQPGDRCAILSENRHEWAVADFASMLCGAVDVPIYATLTADQIAYILKDSGARVIFVSSETQ